MSDTNRSETDDPSSRKRRAFLLQTGAIGLTAGLAGCTGGDSTPTEAPADDEMTDTETPTPEPTPEPTPTQTEVEEMSFDDVTVEYVTWPQFVNNAEAVNGWLHDAGMPEGITVKFSNVFNVSGGARAKFQQWLSADREKPDLMEFDTGWTQPFIVRNQIFPLENQLPDDMLSMIKDEYYPEPVRAATDRQGNLWALPHFPDYPHIQYRKDLARQAGYDPDGNDWATSAMSWKRFSEVTKDILDQTDASVGYLWQAAAGLQLASLVFNEYLSSWGGAYFGNPEKYLFGPIGNRPVTVDEKPVVDSLRMGRSFIEGTTEHTLDGYETISPESVYQGSVFPQFQQFQEGNTVMMRNFPFTLTTLGGSDAFGEDLGTMPMPYGVESGEGKYPGTGGPIHTLGGWNVAVNPNSTNLAAAIEVVKAMTDETVMLKTWELAGWIPPKRSVFQSSAAAEVEGLGRYVDTLRFAAENSLPRPATAIWTLQEKRVGQRANEALQSSPPAEAMKTLKSELQTIENNY